ncbi:HAD-IC family P-type ATPase [Streptomyces hirsutus]|uniref:HAD-IC family P-type ATPase n=1 Tax=Streptomyces hirsutus TaxID=35620 RepID=UPI00341B2143
MNRPGGSRKPAAEAGRRPDVTPATGLSSDEAARRLTRHGPNEIPSEPRIPVWRRVLQQLRDPLVLVLLVAAALTIATGDLSDASVILLVITVNTVVGVVQEVRAEQAVAALSAMNAPSAKAVRDGGERSVAASEVVPGDLVLVAEGDVVPADADVLAAASLLADESSLTGESAPVEKAPDGDGTRGTVSAGTVIPMTVRAVADRLGIAARNEQVTTGDRIREGPAGDLTDVRVYARTTPEQKLGIVQAWREAGHVVAMTGDGVNDGPALRRADIGVAMGRRGTEVARQAADLVPADDNPATIVSAVEEGRRVYANVRRFLLYALAGGTAEILVMLLGPFLGMPLPLLPAQILWINLLTHGLPGVALGAEPVAPATMRHPPRPPAESAPGAGLWPRSLFMGAFIAAVTLAAGVWARETGRPWQSMIFLVLGATQLGVALGSRARPGSLTNPFLLIAVGTALSLRAAGVYLPPLQDLLGTEPLSPTDLVIACALSGLGHVVMRLQTGFRPERPPRGGPSATRDVVEHIATR